jgi:hypothetical protein
MTVSCMAVGMSWAISNTVMAKPATERYARTVTAFFRLAMIRIMLRRLTRPNHSP